MFLGLLAQLRGPCLSTSSTVGKAILVHHSCDHPHSNAVPPQVWLGFWHLGVHESLMLPAGRSHCRRNPGKPGLHGRWGLGRAGWTPDVQILLLLESIPGLEMVTPPTSTSSMVLGCSQGVYLDVGYQDWCLGHCLSGSSTSSLPGVTATRVQ